MEQKDEGYFAYYAKIDKVYRKLCALEVAEYCFTPNEIVSLLFYCISSISTSALGAFTLTLRIPFRQLAFAVYAWDSRIICPLVSRSRKQYPPF